MNLGIVFDERQPLISDPLELLFVPAVEGPEDLALLLVEWEVGLHPAAPLVAYVRAHESDTLIELLFRDLLSENERSKR